MPLTEKNQRLIQEKSCEVLNEELFWHYVAVSRKNWPQNNKNCWIRSKDASPKAPSSEQHRPRPHEIPAVSDSSPIPSQLSETIYRSIPLLNVTSGNYKDQIDLPQIHRYQFGERSGNVLDIVAYPDSDMELVWQFKDRTTSTSYLRQLQEYGLTHCETLTEKVIETLGEYKLLALERHIEGGFKGNRQDLKLQCLQRAFDRTRAIHFLENALNYDDDNSFRANVALYEKALKEIDQTQLSDKLQLLRSRHNYKIPNSLERLSRFRHKFYSKKTVARQQVELQNFIRSEINRVLADLDEDNEIICSDRLNRGKLFKIVRKAYEVNDAYQFDEYHPMKGLHLFNQDVEAYPIKLKSEGSYKRLKSFALVIAHLEGATASKKNARETSFTSHTYRNLRVFKNDFPYEATVANAVRWLIRIIFWGAGNFFYVLLTGQSDSSLELGSNFLTYKTKERKLSVAQVLKSKITMIAPDFSTRLALLVRKRVSDFAKSFISGIKYLFKSFYFQLRQIKIDFYFGHPKKLIHKQEGDVYIALYEEFIDLLKTIEQKHSELKVSIDKQYDLTRQEALSKLYSAHSIAIPSEGLIFRKQPVFPKTVGALSCYQPNDPISALVEFAINVGTVLKNELYELHPSAGLIVTLGLYFSVTTVALPEFIKILFLKLSPQAAQQNSYLTLIQQIALTLVGGSQLSYALTAAGVQTQIIALIYNMIESGFDSWALDAAGELFHESEDKLVNIGMAFLIAFSVTQVPKISEVLSSHVGYIPFFGSAMEGSSFVSSLAGHEMGRKVHDSFLKSSFMAMGKILPLLGRCLLTCVTHTKRPWVDLGQMLLSGATIIAFNTLRLLHFASALLKTAVRYPVELLFRSLGRAFGAEGMRFKKFIMHGAGDRFGRWLRNHTERPIRRWFNKWATKPTDHYESDVEQIEKMRTKLVKSDNVAGILRRLQDKFNNKIEQSKEKAHEHFEPEAGDRVPLVNSEVSDRVKSILKSHQFVECLLALRNGKAELDAYTGGRSVSRATL